MFFVFETGDSSHETKVPVNTRDRFRGLFKSVRFDGERQGRRI